MSLELSEVAQKTLTLAAENLPTEEDLACIWFELSMGSCDISDIPTCLPQPPQHYLNLLRLRPPVIDIDEYDEIGYAIWQGDLLAHLLEWKLLRNLINYTGSDYDAEQA